MTQPATTQYALIDQDAATTPRPIMPMPLEALAPLIPANDAVRKRRIWPWVALGGFCLFALTFSLVYVVGFVTSAEEIDSALNALGIVGGAAFLGAVGGVVGMWAWTEARKS